MKSKNIIIVLFILASIVGYLFLFNYTSKTDEEIALILGLKEVEVLSFDYEEDWDHKDYDIIEIYKLSDSTILKFIKESSGILRESSYENRSWTKLDWNKTPINQHKWNELYDMAIGMVRLDEKHNEWILKAKESINNYGNYFSLYHDEGNPIALYVLDVSDNYLYCIYLKI